MSEENDGQNAGGEQSDFTPITSQEDFERALGKRLERERAKFADYEDLKAKAAKFDEVEEASKTELQKERERAEAAEARASAAEQTALKVRIAAEEGVIPEVLSGSTEEEMRASAKKVIEWRDAGKKPAPKPKTLKSGASADDQASGKERAALALRQLRGSA